MPQACDVGFEREVVGEDARIAVFRTKSRCARSVSDYDGEDAVAMQRR